MFLGSLKAEGHFGLAASAAPVKHVIIGHGDSGIYETVHLMKKAAREGTQQGIVKATVAKVLGGLPAGSNQAETSKAFVRWWMAHIKYRHDDDMSWTEEGLKWININACPQRYKTCEAVEMISDVPQILAQGYGDCDDFVVGLGAFHSLAGIRWCPVVVALDPSIPGEFSHIYLVANLDGSWIPVDAVNSREPWGWEAPNPLRKEILC